MARSRVGLVLLALAAAGPLLAAAADYSSIAQALKANKMTMFTEAADKTGFIGQLQSPGFIGTVFAPTDEAFQAALDIANVTKSQLFNNNSLLVDVIMYHVVPGDAISSDRLRDDGKYTSMRGKALTISKSLGGDSIAVNSGSTATVIDKDLRAGAAMFNVVDNLLLPPDELAALNLKQASAVKFLTTAEEALGYDDQTTRMYQLMQESKKLRDYLANKNTVATVFAPVDDAWYTVEQMSSYYTGNATTVLHNKNALANLLQYHIVDGRAIRAGQLKDKQVLKMMNGEPVTVHVTKEKARKVVEDVAREQVVAARISGVPPSLHLFLTPNTDGDEATLVSANVVAGRSYVHKIDAVLVPNSMLRFLEITSDKKFKTKAKKKGNLTVSEALKGGNGTNASGLMAPTKGKAGNGTADGGVMVVPGNAAGGRGKNSTKAASGAADMAFTAAIGLPALLLAALLVL